MSNPAPQKAREPRAARAITITLTIPRAISLLLFLLVAIVWFFIMGLIIGRGYEPEKDIPALAEILPGKNATQKPSVVQNDPATLATPAKPAPNAESQTARALINEADKAHRNQVKATPPPKTEAPAKKEAQAKKEAPAKTPPKELFDYVYQAASFKQADPAAAFAKKLTSGGIKARVNVFTSGNTKWHRVLVDFRGSPEDTDTLRKDLERFKITKILLVSKKPAKP